MSSLFRSGRCGFRSGIEFSAPCSAKRPTTSRLLALSSLVLFAFCVGCGAVGSPPAEPVTITVTPSSAQPFPGETVQFQASVQNASSSAISWQVKQIPGGNQTVGVISSTGLYTAPATVPDPAAVTVTAALQSAPTATASAIVTIQGPLTISPKLSSITTTETIQLNVVQPAGLNNTEVNWAVDDVPNGNLTVGTVSLSGVYSPPPASGQHSITATLPANPGAFGSATIEVSGFSGMLTWRNDNARSGINNQELALSPITVSAAKFGRLFSCRLDGNAYAQPLYVPNLAIPGQGTHNVVFVATENDSVYAFDADTKPADGMQCPALWQTPLVPTGSQAVASPDTNIIFPTVGITGTPVIDLHTSTLYVVAATQTIGTTGPSSQRLYALDLTTGAPEIQPAGEQISSPATQPFAFFPTQENQRAALLLDNGTVYVAFGSFGENGDYNGWLFAYDSGTLNQTGAFNVTPGSYQANGGIWQSGGGPSADANHNVFVATGAGQFNADKQGPFLDYSKSFLRLENSGAISVSDFFTPCDEASGQILGTTAAVLLPDSAGSTLQPHLLIGGSKNPLGGELYVVNRDTMGGFMGPCPDSPSRVQSISLGGAILSTPLFWNNSIYVAPANGGLTAFPMTGGTISPPPLPSQSPEPLGPQGATPVLSSNGVANAILWLIDSSGALVTPNTPAILRAYDASNLSNEIYSSAMAAGSRDAAGLAVKFSVPTVANGKVYVGTRGELDVYGLLQ